MSTTYELMRIPARSTVELLEDGSVMVFLPDGSARRGYFKITAQGLFPIVEDYPSINLTFKKGE